MISKTSLSAIRALIHIARSDRTVLPPRRIAEVLGESPSYLAKVLNMLVKTGILRAVRGVKGGVQLNRTPSQISLLSIVEACQGVIVGSYCRAECNPAAACAYHLAALELQKSVVKTLSRWNLAHLIDRPLPRRVKAAGPKCLLMESERGTLATITRQKSRSGG